MNAERHYRILRCHRDTDGDWQKTVAQGIAGYPKAKAIAAEMQRRYDAKHPKKTSWTKDLFIPELEKEQWILQFNSPVEGA
jgi:hypothetical protein